MTENTDAPMFGDAPRTDPQDLVEVRRWGYILNAPGKTYKGLNTLQRLSVLFCAYLLSFSLSFATPILLGIGHGIDPMRLAGAVFLTVLAVPFGWYATRGNKAYVYVNLFRNEVREVVPNLIGKPTILRRVPFAEIGGVRIDHSGPGDAAVLLLRRNGEWRRTAVLDGCRRELTHLREKLAQDLFRPQLAETLATPANVVEMPLRPRTASVHFRRIA